MKWISIKDRLPEIEQEIFIRTMLGSEPDHWVGKLVAYIDAYGNEVLLFRNDDYSILDEVTHWCEIDLNP